MVEINLFLFSIIICGINVFSKFWIDGNKGNFWFINVKDLIFFGGDLIILEWDFNIFKIFFVVW